MLSIQLRCTPGVNERKDSKGGINIVNGYS